MNRKYMQCIVMYLGYCHVSWNSLFVLLKLFIIRYMSKMWKTFFRMMIWEIRFMHLFLSVILFHLHIIYLPKRCLSFPNKAGILNWSDQILPEKLFSYLSTSASALYKCCLVTIYHLLPGGNFTFKCPCLMTDFNL